MTRMFVTLVSKATERPFEPGDLVCVEVPLNCTIHDADAQRLIRIVSLAKEIGEHWRNQEGVNGKLLDELAVYTDGYGDDERECSCAAIADNFDDGWKPSKTEPHHPDCPKYRV